MMTEIIRNFEKSDDITQATAESLREELGMLFN